MQHSKIYTKDLQLSTFFFGSSLGFLSHLQHASLYQCVSLFICVSRKWRPHLPQAYDSLKKRLPTCAAFIRFASRSGSTPFRRPLGDRARGAARAMGAAAGAAATGSLTSNSSDILKLFQCHHISFLIFTYITYITVD